MILGQLMMGARQTKNAPLPTMKVLHAILSQLELPGEVATFWNGFKRAQPGSITFCTYIEATKNLPFEEYLLTT